MVDTTVAGALLVLALLLKAAPSLAVVAVAVCGGLASALLVLWVLPGA